MIYRVVGLWSGFSMFEQVAEAVVLDEPTEGLVTALLATKKTLTSAHMEDGARFFARWTFSQCNDIDCAFSRPT